MSQNAAPPASLMQPTRTRSWVVVFAVTLAIIQYIDRVAISQAAPMISVDLSLTPQQMGWVFSAFTLAYALFEIPAGYLGDRIGPRRVLLRIVLWWSFFTAATGFARGLPSLMVTRFLFGAGEAGCFPNLTKAFNRWLPQAERSKAQGIMWMSARWGGAATPLLVFFCLQYMNWRTAFVAFAGLGVVWAAIFYWWYRDNPRDHKGVNAAEAALLPSEKEQQSSHADVPWRKLMRSRTMWCLGGQYAALSYAWYFFVTWFPTYLLKERGFDVKQSALLAGTPLLLGGFGALVAGWLLPILTKSFGLRRARCGLGAFGLTAAAVLLVLSTTFANPYLAVATIALVSFFNDLTMPGAWTACMDVGGRFVGTVGGTMNMMGNLGGFVSPIVVGYVVQTTNSWTLAFYITGGVYLLGAVFWLLLDPVTPLEEQVTL
jgi:ACS family glucarate transporter-like MFS transporter